MVVMWLTLLAWLHGVCNAPERINIHILIVAEHLGGCVANQFKLVFVRGWDTFHQRSKSVAAAVRRVFVALYAVFCLGWVILCRPLPKRRRTPLCRPEGTFLFQLHRRTPGRSSCQL